MLSKARRDLFASDYAVAEEAGSPTIFGRKLRAACRNHPSLLRNVGLLLIVLVLGCLIVAGFHNRRPLTASQVSAMMLEQSPGVRRLAIAELRNDYGINTLGDPITRLRVLDAIDTAEDRVEYDRLVAAEKAASTKSRLMLDTVSTSVERVK